ncbi:hypothetical protein BH24DEI2_BH24DEI2_19660 [soil metagenome]
MSADYLRDAAISAKVAESGGVRRVVTIDDIPEHARWTHSVPGTVFPWHSPNGDTVLQYRPDTAVDYDGEPRKYLWPKGQPSVLNVHPSMSERVGGTCPLVVVEGTKQHLAAVTAALGLDDVAVVGVAGCYGWMTDGQPIADLSAVRWSRPVIVVFDADVATNPNVHAAATRLADELVMRGATSVKFARLPDGGNAGLDDVLAGRAGPDGTASVLAGIIRAAGKLPKVPRGPSGRFFNTEGLRVELLVDEVRKALRLAVDPGDALMVYEHGAYGNGRHAVRATIGTLLGDSYRAMHERSAVELLVAQLATEGVVIPAGSTTAIVNVANGLLDPFTGKLTEHTPDHLSTVQFPVRWEPDATCPTFDSWLHEVTDGRGDDLMEAVSLVLDGRGERQRKAVFAHGPTRSAKSTFIRLIEAVVGAGARSAVTLHDLAGNRFAAADLFGKVLNTANELSAAHVDDLATFKAVTGDDPVRAERKYGQPFTFRNRALFIFAANEIPTVSEVSGAYLARIRPYRFPHSYEGRENPAIERAMLAELPGILVRLVEALARFEARGGYADDDTSRAALHDFARHSDRVRLFLHETTEPADDGFTTRTQLFDTFVRWCEVNRRQPLGRHRFFDHVATAGHRPAKRRGDRGFVGLTVLIEGEWGGPDPAEPGPKPETAAQGGTQGAEGAGLPYPRFTRRFQRGSRECPRGGRVGPSCPFCPLER